MIEKLLIVVYDFPPEVGGGGVMRTVKLIKYLKQKGIVPTVLTVLRKDSYMSDSTLKKDVEGIIVERVRDILNFRKCKAVNNESDFLRNSSSDIIPKINRRLWNIIKWAYHIISDVFLIPDDKCGWIVPAVIKGYMILRKEKADLIYCTAPPFTAFIIGVILSKLTGTKLVIDYRDAWFQNPLFSSKFPLKNIICTILESKIIKHAGMISVTTESIKDSLLKKFPISKDKTKVVWNGYDEKDFEGIDPIVKHRQDIRISYIGGLSNISGKRSPKQLIDAFPIVNKQYSNVKLWIVGNAPPDVFEYIRSKNISNVEFMGTVNHHKSIEYMINSDILVVLLPIQQDGLKAIPGKTFEYMRAGKPILAITPEHGQLAYLINKNKAGYIADPTNTTDICNALSKLITEVQNGANFYSNCNIDFYDRKNQVDILVSSMEKII